MKKQFHIMYAQFKKEFVWHEEHNGHEKYGFLYSSSISGCLRQIEKEIEEEEIENLDSDDIIFEICVDVNDEHGGPCIITTVEQLIEAKQKYMQFHINKKMKL